MFEFPCIITPYYIKNQQDATLLVRMSKVSWSVGPLGFLPDPWHAPVTATTVFSTPDDGRRKRPKHVE